MTHDKTISDDTINWFMEGDPAIRWQVMRDLLDASPRQWKREQAKVATEGWGRRLLDCRDPATGMWGGGIYTPKWTSTTYTLLLLREMGMPRDNPACRESAACILDRETRVYAKKMKRERAAEVWEVHDLCIVGMYLALLTYFDVRDDKHDERIERIVDYLLKQQMSDGGWNCKQRSHNAHHSSLHTTISVLDGLADYAEFRGKRAAKRVAGTAVRVADAIARAHEFLLQHRLYKSDKTGEIIHPSFIKFSFPPRWHWDALRGLDHLRRMAITSGPITSGATTCNERLRRDERLQDAIDLLRSKRTPEGRWPLENHHSGKEFFKLEKLNHPSRWNTLRALRVLRWRDRSL